VKISKVEAFPAIVERDFDKAVGLAGSPNQLSGVTAYRWSRDYPALYSTRLEGTLVRVTLDDGRIGWGECQAPLAPQVPAAIIEHILAPVMEGEAFDGSREEIKALYDRMYATMRVRGQTGGFMLDAIAGVDLALWDLAGKIAGQPVSRLIAGSPKSRVPAYLSGLAGTSRDAKLEFAKPFLDAGLSTVKIYYESDWNAVLDLMDGLTVPVAVDALWHLPSEGAAEALDDKNCAWLECPYMPEEIDRHYELSRLIRTPIALGESYRTPAELKPLLAAASILQPDLGRCGITGTLRIAALGKPIVPHLSIAFGPQIAAAVQVAAALENCQLCEFNPQVLATANRYMTPAMAMDGASYSVPHTSGLGIEEQRIPA
jgi:D-galactarolactone cycloisomerase